MKNIDRNRDAPDSDLRTGEWQGFTTGGQQGGKTKGSKSAKKKTVVAVARKLAVLLHRLWVTGEVYDPHYNRKGTAAQRQAA